MTYANSNIKVGNTTTLDIGNDVNIRGGVINTGKVQGNVGGDVNIESLPAGADELITADLDLVKK